MAHLVVPGELPPDKWTWHADVRLFEYRCKGDGNCFWRAAAVQLFGDEEKHLHVRELAVRYMLDRAAEAALDGIRTHIKDEYGTFDEWVNSTLSVGSHGGYVDAAILARASFSQVEFYLGPAPLRLFDTFNTNREYPCIRFVLYNEHFNALFIPPRPRP